MSTTLNLISGLEGGAKDTPRFDAAMDDIKGRTTAALLALLDIGESPENGDWSDDCKMDVVRCGISIQIAVPIHGFRGSRCFGDSKGWIISDVRVGGCLVVKGGEGFWLELNYIEQGRVSDFIKDELEQAEDNEAENADFERNR